ncbi:MAG: SsrA-binding protein SmpB [Gammaproteobacteria bacterium]|nr:SsrA-binding protein SmpB [Gammaproteobacteria bacterium]
MSQNTIVQNRKALHDYAIEDRYEAGMVLQGWEVKSLREGRAQLVDAHAIIKHGEIFLLGMHISPLKTVSTHFEPDPTRTRKLLLHADEIKKLIGSVDRKGYTLIPLSLYWKKGNVKLELGLAKGKKAHDKRATEKAKDWTREKARIMREKR